MQRYPYLKTFLVFSDQNKISKKNHKAGQRPTTGRWFLLDIPWKSSDLESTEKIRQRKWRVNFGKDPLKHKNTRNMKNLEKGQQRKQNKQMPKWQVLNQISKDLPGWFTIAEKPKRKSWSYPKAFNKILIKNKVNRKLRRHHKVLNDDDKIWLIEFLNQSDITYALVAKTKFTSENSTVRENSNNGNISCGLLLDSLSIANSNTGSKKSFETRFGKELTFSQLFDFLKLQKEYTFNSNVPHTSCIYKKCGKSSLFANGLNHRKKIVSEKFPTNPYDLTEKFSCNSDEGNCLLEKYLPWKSSETIDYMKLDSYNDSSSENTYSSKSFPFPSLSFS